VKIGDNPITIGASSVLELESPTKALVVTRVAQVTDIASPVNGMIIYDSALNCFRGYQSGAWTGCGLVDLSANGSASVSAWNCSTASVGTMSAGSPVQNVSQTITATVIKVGTYNISTTANGVTFAASGSFTATGQQDVILVASGTPGSTTPVTYTINTSPNCNFNRDVTVPPAQISNWSCNTGSQSTARLLSGQPISSGQYKQFLTATVTSVGSYSVSGTNNGISFAASGVFTATGNQVIGVFATGTPVAEGNFSFSLISNQPSCSFSVNVQPGPTQASTGGSSSASGWTCNKASTGTMTGRVPITSSQNVTQTITATVTNVGGYNISTTVNGVTFAGSGFFSATGSQDVVLTASGTPVDNTTPLTFSTGTNPGCSFNRDIVANAPAAVASWDCTTGGVLPTGAQQNVYPGFAIGDYRKILYANVTTVGAYNLGATNDGITFTANGSFTATGPGQQVQLVASGTANNSGDYDFYPIPNDTVCKFTVSVH